MKRITQSLGLGIALLAASAASPRAADWAVGSGGVIKDFGSVKDYRNAAVPVPAPTPTASYSKDWYVRGDLGFNLASSSDFTTTGGVRVTDDQHGFLFGSIGAGRYLTPSLRAELSFDFRPKAKVTHGVQSFSRQTTQAGAAVGTTDTYTYQVAQDDSAEVADQTAFLSLYYDFLQSPGSRFKPYIGAGVGLDSRRFKRTTNQDARCLNITNTDDITGAVNSSTNATWDAPCDVRSSSDSRYTSDLGFAAAVMVGLGYEVSPGITFDTGYRAVWQGASLGLTANSFDGIGTEIHISNRIDHEWRTGVRVDLH
ncbi:MAG: outer membrane beta-barrel protein [Hyphomicrobiaceae bacterium]